MLERPKDPIYVLALTMEPMEMLPEHCSISNGCLDRTSKALAKAVSLPRLY